MCREHLKKGSIPIDFVGASITFPNFDDEISLRMERREIPSFIKGKRVNFVWVKFQIFKF